MFSRSFFSWRCSETVETSAAAAQVWRQWADVANWPRWDAGLEWARLDGAFESGAVGTIKPIGGRAVSFTLTRVVVGDEFVDRSRLPLTTVEFRHAYRLTSDGRAIITHEVSMRGLLAPLFGCLVGRKIERGLRRAMSALSAQAAAEAE